MKIKTPIELWADKMYAELDEAQCVAAEGRPKEPTAPYGKHAREWCFYDAEDAHIDALKAKLEALKEDVDAYVDLVQDDAAILSGRVVGDGE